MVLCVLQVLAQEPVKDQAKCYTTWDDSYFFVSFRVDCPDVVSIHNKPNEEVAGDDAVEVYIEADGKQSSKITPQCFSMAVTANNGSRFRAGNESGALELTKAYSFKYGATVQGTVNNSSDVDMGYTVELALPWDLLKRKKPETGDMMGFNIVIHRHGEKGGFVSLSPNVKTEKDLLDPSKWTKLVFAQYAFVAVTPDREKVVSARAILRPPLMNGVVDDREWQSNTSFSLELPLPEGFVYEAKFPTQHLIFKPYDYRVQGDTRKGIPVIGESIGPWVSYDRTQWHKDRLMQAVNSGVDVILPVFRGDKVSQAEYSVKGLDCLVTAVSELAAEGKVYPLIGLMLNTESLSEAYGKKPDLADEDVQKTLYGMIKMFYDRVPLVYRAAAHAGKPAAGQMGNVVFLDSGSAFASVSPAFKDYCSARFMEDFGCPLVWIASDDFKAKADGLDAYFSAAVDQVKTNKSGRISVGWLDSAKEQTDQAIWSALQQENPDWVVCNTAASAGSLCAAAEAEKAIADVFGKAVRQFLGNKDFDAQLLRCDLPKVIPSKEIYQAEVTIRNIGNSAWKVADGGYALGYRWYKSGRYYGESKIRRPLGQDVVPGDTITIPIGIATVNAEGNAIPEGDCELRLEIVRMSDNKWFSALGDQPVMVPVTIGPAPEWSASYLSCNAPVMMAAGQPYSTTVRVRNDGTKLWQKGVVKMSCKLFKVSNYTVDNPTELNEEVPLKDIRAQLAKDCKPGEIAEFVVEMNLIRSDKKPIEAWRQDYPWSYQLQFDLYNGEKWMSEVAVRPLRQVVDLYASDYGPRVVDCDMARQLTPGQELETKVVVRNNGSQNWDRKRTSLGYHWFRPDGTEVLWDGIVTPIPADIKPGWPAVVTAKVRAPEHAGQYVLVWDVMVDGNWLSAGPISRGGDILPVCIEVAASVAAE